MYLCICVAGHAHEIYLVVSLEITKIQKNIKKEYYGTNDSSRCVSYLIVKLTSVIHCHSVCTPDKLIVLFCTSITPV